MAELSLKTQDVINELTVEVEVIHSKATRFRLWFGVRLITIAAAIIGCNVEIKDKGNE